MSNISSLINGSPPVTPTHGTPIKFNSRKIESSFSTDISPFLLAKGPASAEQYEQLKLQRFVTQTSTNNGYGE